jgi:transcriptional regulator with XRE-family HTH domain
MTPRTRRPVRVATGADPGCFAPTLARLIDERGLSYRVLGLRTGLSAGYLNHLAHGKRPAPQNGVIEAIAAALDVEPASFREYRLRVVVERLELRPELVDRLYAEIA